jgi:putative sterol carrier protein
MDVRELLERVPAEYNVRGQLVPSAVVQCDGSGPGGGSWVLRFHDGRCELAEETDPRADVRIVVSDTDLAALVDGSLTPLRALSQGRLRVIGDWGLAMRLLAALKG